MAGAEGLPRQSDAGAPTIAAVRVGLVGCVKTKTPFAAPAKDLYVSPLFRGRRSYVEWTCDRWFILSAKHGLVSPDQVVEPYEETLVGKSVSEKRVWAESVMTNLENTIEIDGTIFEIHAGAEYRNFGLVSGLRQRGAAVEVPTAHLSQGRQLAFYRRFRSSAGEPQLWPSVAPPPASRRSGSYEALSDHLRSLNRGVEELTFARLERILGRPLPASARRHRAWWANESQGSHSQARSWMGAGWVVDAVDPQSGSVRFRRITP